MIEGAIRPLNKDQVAFLAQHGEPVEVGNIHFWSKDFPGTEEVIARLKALAADPHFSKTYPNHRVFVLPTGEILGVLPAEERPITVNGQLRLVASEQLREKARRQEISLFNCAIIRTGPQKTLHQVLY